MVDNREKAFIEKIAWECIEKFKGTFKADICDPRHKEVEEMKETLKSLETCMRNKFTRLFYSIFGVTLLLILNLLVLYLKK
jgi:hypothetical protein